MLWRIRLDSYPKESKPYEVEQQTIVDLNRGT